MDSEEYSGSEAEKADRHFIELLQESRVAQHGIQIIFAFLLGAAFSPVFKSITFYQKWVYAAAILSAAISTILFVAPVIQHRLLFGRGYKDEIVETANRTTQVALGFMLVAMLCGIFLVMDVAFNLVISSIFVGISGIIALVVWYIIPFILERRQGTLE